MSDPTLEWSTAEVHDGELTVELQGDVPKGWRATFETTARLLGGGHWGECKLRKNKLSVGDVAPGSEERLRHFLESVVQQANATHHAPEEDDEHAEGRERTEADGERPDDSPDARMADRFRSFAEPTQSDS